VKTTVEIPDALFAEAKAVASREGLTLRQLGCARASASIASASRNSA
jgi:hypothetical protein